MGESSQRLRRHRQREGHPASGSKREALKLYGPQRRAPTAIPIENIHYAGGCVFSIVWMTSNPSNSG
jgi:hypothetical protein